MSIDPSSLPVPGGVLLAGLLWAGVSAFALGPMIAERSAEKIGWDADCGKQIITDIEARTPAPQIGPTIGCDDLLGGLTRDERQLMDLFGLGLACKAMDQAKDQKERLLAWEQQRIERAASEAGSRCSCAVAHMTMTKRWDFALAAGTARLVVPPSVSNVSASLLESLASPTCASLAKWEG